MEDLQTIKRRTPFAVIQQEFCSTSEFLIILEGEKNALTKHYIVMAFRINENNQMKPLGKSTFAVDYSVRDEDILKRATQLSSELQQLFDQSQAWKTVTARHAVYEGVKPRSVEVRQIGNSVRVSFVISDNEYASRVMVSREPSGQY